MIKRIVLCIGVGLLSQYIHAQYREITIFEFISVRNNYIQHFNSVNKEIDSLLEANRGRLNSWQKDSLYRFDEQYKNQHVADTLSDILNAKIYIPKSELALFHETYMLTIQSFEDFLKEKTNRVNAPSTISFPEWETSNEMYTTDILDLQNFYNSMDRTVSLYLSQIEYLMHSKNLSSMEVSNFLNQNEHFDYYGILKKGLRLHIDERDWYRYKSYYKWLTERENEYARKRLNILNAIN